MKNFWETPSKKRMIWWYGSFAVDISSVGWVLVNGAASPSEEWHLDMAASLPNWEWA
jgi:hypothetical protein